MGTVTMSLQGPMGDVTETAPCFIQSMVKLQEGGRLCRLFTWFYCDTWIPPVSDRCDDKMSICFRLIAPKKYSAIWQRSRASWELMKTVKCTCACACTCAGKCAYKRFEIYLSYPEEAFGEKHTLKPILCQDLSQPSRGSKTKLTHFKVSSGKWGIWEIANARKHTPWQLIFITFCEKTYQANIQPETYPIACAPIHPLIPAICFLSISVNPHKTSKYCNSYEETKICPYYLLVEKSCFCSIILLSDLLKNQTAQFLFKWLWSILAICTWTGPQTPRQLSSGASGYWGDTLFLWVGGDQKVEQRRKEIFARHTIPNVC